MDPNGEVFSDDENPNNLHYRYANSVLEAIEFTLVHEIAHTLGIPQKEDQSIYTWARKVILEIRRAKRGMAYDFRPLFNSMNRMLICAKTNSDEAVYECDFAEGPPPNVKVH